MKRYIRAAVRDIIDEPREVLLKIAQNPRTRTDILDKLVYTPSVYDDSHVMDAVAKNPNTSPDTLKFLLRYPGIFVQESVASNLSTSMETLNWIVDNSKYSWVRQAARRTRSQLKKQNKQKRQ